MLLRVICSSVYDFWILFFLQVVFRLRKYSSKQGSDSALSSLYVVEREQININNNKKKNKRKCISFVVNMPSTYVLTLSWVVNQKAIWWQKCKVLGELQSRQKDVVKFEEQNISGWCAWSRKRGKWHSVG